MQMNVKLRTAPAEEVGFYKKVVYPAQDRILSAVSRVFGDAFYLTGGTALSRFYFQHRLSEDIDLFTEGENIKTAVPRLVGILEKELGYTVSVKAVSTTFGRLFVSLGSRNRVLKMDLAADYPLEKPKLVGNFHVDTLKNIAVNKIAAFENRAELKDLVDLYFLVNEGEIDLMKALDLADRKRVPIPYEQFLAINTLGLTGSVSLLKNVKAEHLEKFLKHLKEVLEENIKKKLEDARRRVKDIIQGLLWDLPFNERVLNRDTFSLLMRRSQKLPYPERLALKEFVDTSNMLQ